MDTNMYSGVGNQIFIFASIAIFIGANSAILSWLVDREKKQVIRIGAVAALALVSLAAFFLTPDKPDIYGIFIFFIAILWFPAAIVLSSQIVPGIYGMRSLPYHVLTVSAIVYMTEFFIGAYIGPALTLRSSHVLILLPPPPLPYAWMQMPDGYLAIIQFFVTLIIASLIFWIGSRISRYSGQPSEGTEGA